nr:hypothetical protein OG781_42870 [Streptomyces sp. NBC_00830]
MRTRLTTAAITAGLLLATLTACGGSDTKADPAACKTAMTKQLSDAIAGQLPRAGGVVRAPPYARTYEHSSAL